MSNQKATNVSITKLRSSERIIDLNDPRSPSSDFRRTPIRVVLRNSDAKSNENGHGSSLNAESIASVSSTPSDSDEGDHMDVAEDELQHTLSSSSSFVSIENTSNFYGTDLETMDTNHSAASNSESSVCHEIEEDREDKTTFEPFVEPENNNSKNAKKLLHLNDDSFAADTFCHDRKSSQKSNASEFNTPNKKRNPLESVETNCLQPVTPISRSSPHVKQWKRIREERQKLGLACDENFALPLYDVTASAPGKLMIRKQKITEFS